MQSASYRLENAWQPAGGPHGRFTFSLFNLSTRPIEDFTIAYTSLTRVIDPKACENASFVKRDANYHEFAPPTGFVLAPGASWTFSVSGLHRKAVHCTDGAKSAYLTLSDGSHVTVAVSDLRARRPRQRATAGAFAGRKTRSAVCASALATPDRCGKPGRAFRSASIPPPAASLEDLSGCRHSACALQATV